MKSYKLLIVVFFIGFWNVGLTQNSSPYVIRILNFDWMPDDTFILTIMKFDKSRKEAPLSRVYQYNPRDKSFQLLIDHAGRPSSSPDGKRIAFEKKLPGDKSDVYLYDIATGSEMPLLKGDTLYKFAPNWSPDGAFIAYNVKRGLYNKIDICIANLKSGTSTQITQSGEFSSYNPVWSPDSKRLVYYFEKGDNRDQIFITDPKGSYHINISADTSVHNYYPSWVDNETILYTWAPSSLAFMRSDGTQKNKLENISTFFARYNARLKKIAFLQIPQNHLVLYDEKMKTSDIIIDTSDLDGLF